MKGGDNMSDIEQAIRDIVQDEISCTIQDQVSDALSGNDQVQDLQYKLDDLEQQMHDYTNDDDFVNLVVDHLVKRLIGDSNRVISKSHVQSLNDEITKLKSELADKNKSTAVNE
tara:strand:+ start:419 stop:760 length:342 start_codon:yes stop_codon:yes gene_type:complete